MLEWANSALQAFGREVIGLDNLQLNEQGVAGFKFDSGESLYFQAQPTRLAVSLLLHFSEYERTSVCEKIMQRCHYRCERHFQVKPGLFQDNTLTLSIVIEQDQINSACLDAAVAQLRYVADPVVNP